MDSADEIKRLRDDLSIRCRDGFPLIDSLYWERPSPKMGGWFVRQLKPLDAPAKGSAIDLRYPTRERAPLAQVVERLKAEHHARYWYRGQRMRRHCTYRGTVPAIDRFRRGLTPIQATLEALSPSAFRHITDRHPALWDQFVLLPPSEYLAGPMRAIMESDEKQLHDLLLQCLDYMVFEGARLAMSDRVRLGYDDPLIAGGTTIARDLLNLISIAQHYEYGSVMIDVSKDIDIAIWFATRDWNTGALAGSRDGSPGAIYRFDADRISAMMDHSISGPGATPPVMVQIMGIFGLADISGMFPFLQRPRLQQGGSLLGMENIVTHLLLQMHEAAEVFPFDHDSVRGDEIGLSAEDIRPSQDKGCDIFRPDQKFSSVPITPEELDRFLGKAGEPSTTRDRLVEHRRNRVI